MPSATVSKPPDDEEETDQATPSSGIQVPSHSSTLKRTEVVSDKVPARKIDELPKAVTSITSRLKKKRERDFSRRCRQI